jgi:hypothetical protein
MKGASIKLIPVILLLLCFSGCEKAYIVSKSQDILFEVEFINHAWVETHYGIIIDVSGNVLTYNLPGKWNFPKDDQTITKEEVLGNVSKCLRSDIKIASEELHKYVNYIDNISASKVTAPKSVAADAGTTTYYCYQYSEGSSTYKRIVIKETGDFERENLNYYSKKVVEWINGIRGQLQK